MGNPNKLRARVVEQGVEKVLKDRGEDYGPAWSTTGEILRYLITHRRQALFDTQYVFNWMMILNKLARILASPNNPDHWMDIAGYATLVYKDLEAVQGFNETT